jgi:hypothetical protein
MHTLQASTAADLKINLNLALSYLVMVDASYVQ